MLPSSPRSSQLYNCLKRMSNKSIDVISECQAEYLKYIHICNNNYFLIKHFQNPMQKSIIKLVH